MPSLAAGTNWTFTGRLVTYPGIAPECVTPSVPVKYLVVVTSAGDLSTNYSDFENGSLVNNLKQQAVVLTITQTVAGVSTVKNFYGLFKKGQSATGDGTFYASSNEFVYLDVVTSDSVCSGKQAAKLTYTNAGTSYSTVNGYVCRNNNVL